MFCRKKTGHTGNDKLLIHCFQESLTRFTAIWYLKLDRSQVHTWTDLVKAFLAQYDHVVDIAPDHISLIIILIMEKKKIESFKDYGQRWRDISSQVQSSLVEKETTIVLNTLLKPYYMIR